MALELFQCLSGLQAVDANEMVERGCKQLRAISRECDAVDTSAVRMFKSAQASACGQLPDLDLAVFASRRQHFSIATERFGRDPFIVHHELILGLILQVLAQLALFKIPGLDKPVLSSRDKHTSIEAEASTLRRRRLAELDFAGSLADDRLGAIDRCLLWRSTKQVVVRSRRHDTLLQ